MNALPVDKPVVAAFDFDGTLTRRDTLLPFLLYTLGMGTAIRQTIMSLPLLAAYALGLIHNGKAKEKVLVRCFAGMSRDELNRSAERFAAAVVPGLLRPDAMRRLVWHKQQGHRCVAISASLEIYVRPWAMSAGFDDVLATRLDIPESNVVTGKFSGENCYGGEKVRRLECLLGARDGYTLYAYGDSRGDAELLASADHPYYRSFSKN